MSTYSMDNCNKFDRMEHGREHTGDTGSYLVQAWALVLYPNSDYKILQYFWH